MRGEKREREKKHQHIYHTKQVADLVDRYYIFFTHFYLTSFIFSFKSQGKLWET